MCGIAGFSRGNLGEKEVRAMLERIAHRGPDDRGLYLDEGIALGSVLLAIVDIGNGRQPFVRQHADETYVAVFNGEIYNHARLREELEECGMTFRTRCDTEVALAAYARWGADAVQRFDGQWALAVWEVKARRLFLCRDPFGIKPLFYWTDAGSIAFASEPKALFALPTVVRRPNVDSIREYFLHGFAFASGYSLNHRSFYAGVHSVPPGHFLRWTAGCEPTSQRYFDLIEQSALRSAEVPDAAIALNAAVRRSTEACLMGDAPIGVALSGGLDSSVITAIAARALSESGNSPLLSSCIRYEGQGTNEDAEHAALLASWLEHDAPLRLVYSSLTSERYMADVDGLVYHFDEPHWEVKQLAMFNNYRNLRQQGAKVVLTGEGADELFFGYYHRFPGFKHPKIGSAAEFRGVWDARLPDVQRLFANTSRDQLQVLRDFAIDRFYVPAANAAEEPARCMQHWYLATFLHWLLIDNDRCSMAFSLEGRFPFLNREVYSLAMRLAPAVQLGGEHGQEKMILRRAFQGALPEAIWLRRKKAPLPSPLRLAFHATLRDSLRQAIDDVPSGFWDVMDRKGVDSILIAYTQAIAHLQRNGSAENGGDALTSYLRLNEPWAVRTPHAFGLLTLIRWWKMNFS